MEITVYNPTQGQPLPPIEWNYPEVKQWVTDGLARYEGVVYDESQMAEAKKDRANLNKLVQAIDAKRREMKQLYLSPYEEFETQAKELTGMIKKQAEAIDAQVKAYEAARKQEKRDRIEAELYTAMIGNLAELVPYDRLHETRWLNATCSMGTVAEELGKKIDRIISGLDSIIKLDMDNDLVEHTRDVFLRDFDLAAALADTDRLKKQREAVKKALPPETPQNGAGAKMRPEHENIPPNISNRTEGEICGKSAEETIHVVDFRIRATASQLKALKQAMNEIGIKPEKI